MSAPAPPQSEKAAMKAYRLLTGKDDSAFCHKVTAALAAGWELHGSPTITYDTAKDETVCAQAVVKDVPGQKYDPSVKLGAL
jgi:hypothetical protein